MPLNVIRHDISKVKADVIVNTANPKPIYAGGTDTAIYEAAGAELLLEERKKIGIISPGDIAVTPAFKLKAKYIIHAVGPVWEGGNKCEFDILKSCYEKSLAKAVELKCKSIAFPLMATGINGFPRDKALQIAISSIQNFIMFNDIEVILVVFNAKVLELTGKVFNQIEEFIDSNYVEDATYKEYWGDIYGDRPAINRERRRLEELELHGVINKPPKKNSFYSTSVFKDNSKENQPKSGLEKTFDKEYSGNEKTFQERLFELQDERGIKSSKLYKDAGLSKAMFSNITSDKYYQPTKSSVIQFASVLELSINELEDLLSRAGYTLSKSNKSDMVIKACFTYGKISLIDLNLELVKHNCEVLGRKFK